MLVETRTGALVCPVFPTTASWSRLLNISGRGSSTFQLGIPALPIDYYAYTRLWAYSIVYFWDGNPIYWGVITSRRYDKATQKLTVRHADIRKIFTRRYPFGVASYWADEPNHIPGSLVLTDRSLRGIAQNVVKAGLEGPSDIYSLPIVQAFLTETGSHSRTYWNYHFQTVADILEDLQNIDGGPDIDFEPELGGSGVQLRMRTGTPSQPSISGSTFDFAMSAPLQRLEDLSLEEDGEMQLTGQFGIGQGSERDMRVGGAGIAGAATIPALDFAEEYKTESSEPILALYGLAAVKTNEYPTRQYEMSFRASTDPGLAALRLGSLLDLHWSTDPFVPDGKATVRVISMSGDESENVTLDVQTWVA